MASPGSDSTAAAAAAPAADAGAGLSVTAPRVVHNLGEWSARERHQARRLMAVFVLVALFFGVELAGATMANSDVLRIDALHLLTDVGALAMALMAMRLAVRRPTVRFTFGWRRAEPVAAIFNAGLVLAATLVLILEAVKDMRGTGSPRADIMLYVASGALVVNGISAWLIHDALHAVHALPDPGAHDHAHHHEHDHNHGHDHHEAHAHEHKAHAHKADAHAHGHGHAHGHSLNLRGAWLHLLGDALGSLAALVAAVLIRLGFSPKVDPCASLVVAAILIVGAVRLLRDAGLILLEAAPRHLPVGGVESAILSVSGVAGIHELHIWTLGAGHDAITAHVLAEGEDPSVGMRVESAIRKRFQVEYVTVQIETEAALCQGIPLKSRVGT